MLTLQSAFQLLSQTVTPSAPVRVPLENALHLSVAEDILAPHDSPPFDKSMMDGFGLRFDDWAQGNRVFDIVAHIPAGSTTQIHVQSGQAVRIMTGAPIPRGVDLVIPIEATCGQHSELKVQLEDIPATRGLHIIHQGDNIKSQTPLLSSGTTLYAQHLGALAEFGITDVCVRPRPTVAILATGDEIVPFHLTPEPGQIRNSNELMLASQITQFGGIPIPLGIVADNQNQLADVIQSGLNHDLLLLTGGVSAGDFDYVPTLLKQAGVQQVFHKIQLKPGKPVWFGVFVEPRSSKRTYVFGLPGNPVSSLICAELFVGPTIHTLMHRPAFPPRHVSATLSAPYSHKGDRPTYHPARLVHTSEGLQVQTVPWKGSSDLSATLNANSAIAFPAGNQHYLSGEIVSVLPWAGLHSMFIS